MQKPSHKSSQSSIVSRFAHLLSAQGLEAGFTTIFFLYLAWLDSTLYGQVMYALAAGGIVMKVIQYGLYYPLVAELGTASPQEAPEILNRVNVIKLLLMIPAMLVVVGTAVYRKFSLDMALVLIFICLGFALEGVAETFFAELRVRGRQDQEARIKILSTILSYGFGMLTAALGMGSVVVSLFRLISAFTRIGYGVGLWMASYAKGWRMRPDGEATWSLFRAATTFALIEILGVVYNKTNIFFLEGVTTDGVKNVALFSATWNIVDPVSTLASEQFLGWVVFPLLATLWHTDNSRATELVRSNACWLLVLSFPIMFVLHTGSDFFIRTIYPAEYTPAAWMQRYLVWTIVLSFEGNLFSYLMMVAGASRVLLGFTVLTTILNFVFNIALVERFDLLGGCLVIIFTKLVMTVLTFSYCQIHFRLFRWGDVAFPLLLAGASLSLYMGLKQFMMPWQGVVITLAVYLFVLRQAGNRFMGSLQTPLPHTRCHPTHTRA